MAQVMQDTEERASTRHVPVLPAGIVAVMVRIAALSVMRLPSEEPTAAKKQLPGVYS